MTKAESLALIRDYMSKQAVEWVAVFGPFARDEMNAEGKDPAVYPEHILDAILNQ